MLAPYMKLKKSYIILQLFLISSSSWGNEVTNLCATSEAVYFSCQTEKGILSLCGSKKDSNLEGIQVRLGTMGSIKFKYPNSMDNSIKAFKYSRYTRPLVTNLKISFESGLAEYDLYSDSSYEETPKREDWAAGLNKISGSNFEDLAVCSKQPINRLAELEDILENRDFFE